MSVRLMSNDGSTSCFLDQEILGGGKKFTLEELLGAWKTLHPEFCWLECEEDGCVLWCKPYGEFGVLWSDSVFKMVRRLAAMDKLPGKRIR